MKLYRIATAAFLLIATPHSFALDAACAPILAAGEARTKLAAWHSIANLSNMQMESMKINGQFFQKLHGKWMKSRINFDENEKTMIQQVTNGTIKLTECKSLGADVVDGIPVNVVSSKIEMPGAPASTSKLYIGKQDGLPYKQIGDTVNVVYKYKGFSAPQL